MIPEEIKIGNRTVLVQISDIGEDMYGMFDPNTQVIYLNSNLTMMQAVETFWHELIHAINDYNRFTEELAMELETTDNPDQDAFNFEERMTENFAKVFLQVIQDNNLLGIQNE